MKLTGKAKYSHASLNGLLRTMILIRECEEALIGPITANEVHTPCHLYTGQEAVAAGVMGALGPKDYIFGNHRSHGHYLAKGGSVQGLLSEIFCREDGCARGRGGSMHLVSPEHGMLGAAPIVAGTIPLALGSALASSIRGDGRVTVTFFGDGATGEGVLYESLNFAALRKLPIVFVCENNLYSTHMPIREIRTNSDIHRIAKPFDIRSWRIDGNDVLRVHATAQEAVTLCRRGRGPAFIECLTYRFRGHVGPNDNIQGTQTDIRPAAEIKRWVKRDPISKLERFMLSRGVISDGKLETMRRLIKSQVMRALAHARKAPAPSPQDLEKYVYG